MLSFLREQNGSKPPAQTPEAPAGKAPGNGATPAVQDQDYLTVAAHGKRARKSTTVLIVLFIIGLLCLWFMIKKCAPQAASATTTDMEETKVEAALARLTGLKSQVFSRMDEIVKKFYEFSGVQQVQVNELAKNPFALESFMEDIKETPTPKNISETDRAMIEQRNLKLLSIMRSDQGNSCMIGSKILCEGDSIQGFTVRQIGDSFVKLQWIGRQADGAPEVPSNDSAPSEKVEVVLRLSE
jgi:preprotein translocase subunit SecG